MNIVCGLGLLLAVFGCVPLPLQGLTFPQFVQCVGPTGTGLICQLDAGVYPVNSTIQIGRSNFTIKGTLLTSGAGATLQRASGFTNQLLVDLIPPLNGTGLKSITIRDLTIDGNRAQNNAGFASYKPEIAIFTTQSVLVANCNLINSPHFSLALYGAGASGLVVSNTKFLNGFGGFWSGPTGNHGGEDYTACPNDVLADDVIVANSRFDGFDTNALYASATNVQLVQNYFTDTYSLAVGSFVPAGGQIDLDPCTANAAVVGNTFEGGTMIPGAGNTQGMEFHGTNITAVNNTVSNNWHDGISIGGAAQLFIANWDPAALIKGNRGAGIAIHQGDPGAYDSQRPVDFVTIDSVNVTNNSHAGIWANDAVVPVNHLAITGTCVSGNADPQISLSQLGPDVTLKNNLTSGCPAK